MTTEIVSNSRDTLSSGKKGVTRPQADSAREPKEAVKHPGKWLE